MIGVVSSSSSYCAYVRHFWSSSQSSLAVKVPETVIEGLLSSVTVTENSVTFLIGSRECLDCSMMVGTSESERLTKSGLFEITADL